MTIYRQYRYSKLNYLCCLIAAVSTLFSSCLVAAEKKIDENNPWSGKVSLTYGLSSFNAGDREDYSGTGLRINLNHYSGFNLVLGGNKYSTDYTNTATGATANLRANLGLETRSTEKSKYLSTSIAFPDQQTGGKIVGRFDWLRNSNSISGAGLRSLGFRLSLQKSDAASMLDIGYNRTSLDGDSQKFTQWSPTFSFLLNGGQEWGQIRIYSTKLSNQSLHSAKKRFNAIETKFIQALPDSAWLMPEQVQFTLLKGNRVYQLDPDSFAINSTGHVQTAGYGISGQWPFYGGVKLKAGVNIEQYEAKNLSDDEMHKYTQRYSFVAASYDW